MNFYNHLNDIFDFLISIRKLETYLVIDVEFPATWKILKKYVDEKRVTEQKSASENSRIFSFVTEFAENDILSLISSIKSIIDYNVEREEKNKLFDAKVEELRKFFEQTKLSELKTLTFNVINDSIFIENDEESEQNGKDSQLVRE
jgi:hypothetical protein